MGRVEEKDESFGMGWREQNNLSLSDFTEARVRAKPSYESKSSGG